MLAEGWHNSYPMVMRKNGYYTGLIGKNHVPIGEGGYESGLMEKSFDYWYAGHGHLSFYTKNIHDIFKGAMSDTQAEIIAEGIQDFLTNAEKLQGALNFLDHRSSDKPFMLSVNFNLPHDNETSSMEQKTTDDEIYRTLYRDQEIPLPDNYIAKADIKNSKLPPEIHHVKDRQVGYDWGEIFSGAACTDTQINGHGVMPLLKGEKMASRNIFFFRSYEDQYTLFISGDWKLVKYHSGKFQLFNVSEETDLIDIELEKAKMWQA